uniref:Uncharacterized protein n=1 Tax=Timema genevievae TaxID=629358 RepID=A0A7R9K6C4_TIMGE|nr:unnamed protein product [Timema genevievae]
MLELGEGCDWKLNSEICEKGVEDTNIILQLKSQLCGVENATPAKLPTRVASKHCARYLVKELTGDMARYKNKLAFVDNFWELQYKISQSSQMGLEQTAVKAAMLGGQEVAH